MEKLTLKGTRFVNESGKEVILHGLNVLQRQRENNHFYPGFEKAFGYFRRSGFNLLRFGIFWDGAEPEPGADGYGVSPESEGYCEPGGGKWHLHSA